MVGDPMDEATDVSALISEGERDRVKAWVDEAVGAGATVVHGGEVDDARRARADRAHRRHAGDEGVLAGGVRSGRRRSPPTTTSTTRCGWPTTPATACRRRSSPTTSATRMRGVPDARLRRRARQRGADVAGRPAAVRRRARQRQHPRGPGVLGARDDRAAHGRPLPLIRRTVGADAYRRWMDWWPSR